MFEASLGTAACFIAIFFYFDIKKVAGMAVFVDILVFGLFLYIFKGTYAGMMTGIFAGLFITFFLRAIRKSVGYETPGLFRTKGNLFPRFKWKRTEGLLR